MERGRLSITYFARMPAAEHTTVLKPKLGEKIEELINLL